MEIALLVLLALAIPLSGVAGFFMALRLRSRMDLVEARLREAEARLGIEPVSPFAAFAPVPAPAPGAAPPAEAPAQEKPTAPPDAVETPPAAAAPTVVPPIAPAAPGDTAPVDVPVPPSRGRGLEEQFGTRWAVWIGGIALALGGLFLVRYSIEQGLLGPGARVAAGALFALVLVGLGEWLRRRETPLQLGEIPSAHIPSIVTGAGVLTAFATVYAAYALYALIGPATAFLLLGAISILGMVASALHGPALAGIGLVATQVSPLLVSSDRPQFWPVVIYLAFAAATAYGVARLRLWRWLAIAAAIGAIVWTPVILLSSIGDVVPAVAHLLVQTGLAAFFLAASPHRDTGDEEARLDPFASAVLFVFGLLAVLVGMATHLGDMRAIFAIVMVILLLGTGIRFAPVAAAAAWAGLVAIGILAVWPVAREIATEAPTALPSFGQASLPTALVTFLAFAAVVPLGVASLSLWRVVRGGALPWPLVAFYLGAAALTPLGALVVAYWRIASLERSLPFALVAGLLAAAYVGTARWLRAQTPDQGPGTALATGAAASAALAALALGLTFALDKGMLTVAFALTALGTAYVADRTALPVLRYAVAAMGVLVLGRLAWSPTIVGGDPGATPIVNWLLWGYGVPAVSFFLASRLLDRAGRDRITRFIESLALVFASFLVFFEIRHGITGRIDGPPSGHLEAGLIATQALAFAAVLIRVDLRRPDPVYRIGSFVFSVLSVGIAVFGLLVAFNPVFGMETIEGGRILNSLIPAYLLPAALAALVAVLARGIRSPRYVLTISCLALALHLNYLLVAIRCFYQGPEIDWDAATSEAEQWTYSAALLASGLALLALGFVTRSRFLRLASVAYLMLAVLKVFIIDLSNLEGIMRALSFIALGAVLIGIGLVYQRLLTRPGGAAAGPVADAPS